MSNFEDILDEPDEIEAAAVEPTETPAAPTETTESAAEPEAVAEAPAEATTVDRPALPDGYKYDATGRVHGPDGRVVAKEKVAELLAQTPAVATPTEPVAPPAPPPEPAKPAEPFRYRAMGQTHELKDIKIDGTPEAIGQVRQLLNWAHMVPTLQSENAKLQRSMEQQGQNETRAKALVDSLTPLLSEPDEAKALEAFFQLRTGWTERVAKAEVEYWRQKATAGQQQREAEPVQSSVPDEQAALSTTYDHLEDLRVNVPEFGVLTDADWKQLREEVSVTPFAFLRRATREHAQQVPGVRPGQVVFDTDALVRSVQSYVKRTSAAREAEAAAKKAKEAARFNAQQQPTKPGTTTRPTATAKQPALAGTPAKAKGWDQTFKAAWDDDTDDDS